MLIRRAEIDGLHIADLRIEGAQIAAVGEALSVRPHETVIEAAGRALFPGLHDHHMHLAAYAASLDSVSCGPPEVQTAEHLATKLASLNQESDGWLRGTGYHESVAGPIDRFWLDRVVPSRPVRIQHRSGRLWIFNGAGLDHLNPKSDDPLEREGDSLTGRLYDADGWLRVKLPSRFPSLARASGQLAQWGVTGVTDATASNGLLELAQIRAAQQEGALLQSVLIMGNDALNSAAEDGLCVGPRKFHLHDAALPSFDATVAAIRSCHAVGRAGAFHCVTRADLAFALAALETAGARFGDRIEHAAVAPPELAVLMRALGVTVVTQPNFISERGDRYLAEVPVDNQPWLYRARGLAESGIPLAGGTDAPFGNADPWALMAAAVHRRTRQGHVIGADEALSTEEALGLFLGDPKNPGGPRRRIMAGVSADLVLLDRSWALARRNLAAVRVSATLNAGTVIFRQ